MPDEMSMLERKVRSLTPAADSFDRMVARREQVRRRRHRNRRLGSAVIGLAAFGVAVAVLIGAPWGSDQRAPSSRRVPSPGPPPIGVAPDGLGSLETIQALSADDAVALADHGLIATSDGGLHWRSIAPPDLPQDATYRMFFLDRLRGWIAAWPRDDRAEIRFYRTTDGGEKWMAGALSLPALNAQAAAGASHLESPPPFGFSDPLHGWTALTNTIPTPTFFTSDGGITWNEGTVAPEGDQFMSFTFSSPSDGWAIRQQAISIPNGDREVDWLARTTDGGRTWSRVDLPPPPIPVADPVPFGEFLSGPRFFGSDEGIVLAEVYDSGKSALFAYVTHDGGTTWSASDAIPLDAGAGSPIFGPSFVSPSTWVIVSTSGQIASTTDGGATWDVFRPDGLDARGVLALEFSSASEGWALSCDVASGESAGSTICNGPSIEGATGSYDLFGTDDGGRTWTLILSNRERSAS